MSSGGVGCGGCGGSRWWVGVSQVSGSMLWLSVINSTFNVRGG